MMFIIKKKASCERECREAYLCDVENDYEFKENS